MTDNTIPLGKPGIAHFESETWGGPLELRYGEGVLTTTHITITAPGGGLELPLGSVIAESGVLAQYNATPGANTAFAVLATAIAMTAGQTMSIPVYREGHLNMDALNWHTSYDTDAKKRTAFEGSKSPTIFVSKPRHSNDTIYD